MMVRETFYCPMSALSISVSMCPPRASQHHPYVRWGQEDRGTGASQALLRPQGGWALRKWVPVKNRDSGQTSEQLLPRPCQKHGGGGSSDYHHENVVGTSQGWVPRHLSVSSQPMLSPQHGSSTSWCSDQCGCSNGICRVSSGVPGPPACLCSLGAVVCPVRLLHRGV